MSLPYPSYSFHLWFDSYVFVILNHMYLYHLSDKQSDKDEENMLATIGKLRTNSKGCSSKGSYTWTDYKNLYQLCEYTWDSLQDVPRAMYDSD